jgi:putative membrane protein insertion efficiency factor
MGAGSEFVMDAMESPLRRRVTAWPLLCAVFCIRCYQAFIRPHLLGGCRFHPTCSEFGIEALSTHGLFRGGGLTLRRLLRCHPFAKGGFDPVPPRRKSANVRQASTSCH